jgi:methylmalonyl-CoA epimerase
VDSGLGITILGIHHIGIVVRDLEAAIQRYQALGFRLLDVLDLPDQGVRIAAFVAGREYLELLTPLGGDSGVARYLAARGDGVHHVAYAVPDLAATLQSLARAGFELIDREPRLGLHGWLVAFIHPRSCHGVLTELVQLSPSASLHADDVESSEEYAHEPG